MTTTGSADSDSQGQPVGPADAATPMPASVPFATSAASPTVPPFSDVRTGAPQGSPVAGAESPVNAAKVVAPAGSGAGVNETCWTLIHAAGAGDAAARSDFVRRYQDVVRAYLRARWHGMPLHSEVDDAVQEVFVDCLRAGGALQRARQGRGEGFRAFLFGVVRNVALHVERSAARQRQRRLVAVDLDALAARDESSASMFDRAWARAVMRQAAELQMNTARGRSAAAEQRAQILHLRFHEGMPIRDIARMWDVDAARVHHEYARAREEFAAALQTVVAQHRPAATPAAEIEQECARLLALLQPKAGRAGADPHVARPWLEDGHDAGSDGVPH